MLRRWRSLARIESARCELMLSHRGPPETDTLAILCDVLRIFRWELGPGGGGRFFYASLTGMRVWQVLLASDFPVFRRAKLGVNPFEAMRKLLKM